VPALRVLNQFFFEELTAYMKIAVVIARVLLGLVFLVFGLNVYFAFIPTPPIPGDAGAISGLMFAHRWFHFYGLLYVVAGVLLLVGRYIPLALVLLGPILVNILLFHITLAPSGIGPGLFCAVLEVFLIWAYWPAFRGIFTAKMEVG
jgi:putative oxidoreductase